RKLDFRQEFILTVTGKVVTFAFAVSVAVIYQSYWALVVGAIAGSFATLILSYVLISYRPRLSLAKWKDLLSFSIWLTLGTWVQTVNWRSTPLLFGYFLPTALLGQYRVGHQLMGRTVAQAVKPIKSILFPAFSRLQDDSKRLRKGYMRSQGAICLITLPVVAGVALVARDLVLLLVGEKWLPAVPVIQIYAVVQSLRALHNVNALAMATDNTKRLFFREVFLLMVRWPPILVGIYLGRSDPYSMLIGAMLGQIVSASLNTWWNMRLIAGISPIQYLDHASFAWRPILSVAAMIGSVLLASSVLPGASAPLELAARIAALSLLGAATYVGSLFAIWVFTGRGETIERELATIIRDLAKKLISKARAA
ncbi:MAG: oligosaccharide flippase family protein, partial [Erythrobacter sp.]|nr:oligosaccharide flippase family protein [Erythrobacter sp.]